MWATGKTAQNMECILDGGRYYDPYRPSLTEDGFTSADKMLEARRITLTAMLDAIKQADLFIFTLGLTEAWGNKDGSVYPMCPGTIRGEFTTEDHMFKNFNEQEVVQDLNETLDVLRGLNPHLRFLLTVSPVPLTATASGQHVLTATTYSKSVLRSAAGYLLQVRDDVDYFPSYELITAPAFKGQFYEHNMRSVSPDGVAFVMEQFFAAIGVVPKHASKQMSAVIRTFDAVQSEKIDFEDEICDEIVLDTWNSKSDRDSKEFSNILLVGDSQIGKIAEALSVQEIPYAGGAIMNASEWDAVQFDLDDEKLFSPHDPDQRSRWELIYSESVAKHSNLSTGNWLITDTGVHRHHAILGSFESYRQLIHGGNAPVDAKVIELHGHLLLRRKTHLALLCRFLQRGYSTIIVTDPPIENPQLSNVMSIADKFFCELYESIGCSVFNARDWIIGLGGMPERFKPAVPSMIHAGPEYYLELTKAIFERFSIEPGRRQSVNPAKVS
jgi:hypothetical protein